MKAAVIGLGVGEQHIAGYLNHPCCQVVALCDSSAEKLAEVSARHPGVGIARAAEEILLDPGIDVVSIASYDDAHFTQVLTALKSGKHVFVEKPLCQSLDQLRRIKEAWAQHRGKVKLVSNLVLRAAPAYAWLKQQLAIGTFGEVYAFDGDYLYGRLHKITEGWRKDVENYSVMEGGGIHLLDLSLWLTGERPSSVLATGNRICTRGTSFRYNDYVVVTLKYPSGMVGRISANFGCVHRHQHVVRIFGTKATFVYDDAGPRLHTSRDSAVSASPSNLAPLPGTKGALIPVFVSAILNDEDISLDTQTFFDAISICAACDRALATHSEEEVQYV